MILGTSMSVAVEMSTLSDVDSSLEWVVTCIVKSQELAYAYI